MNDDFERIFLEQFPLIFNYVFYHVGNTQESEDLTADIFVQAYLYWGSYVPEKGSRGEWLGGITRNMVRTYLRKRASKPYMSELSENLHADVDTESEIIRRDDLRQVLLQLRTLPEKHRQLLKMKFFLCYTNRDIAKIMHISESNVGVTLHRIIKKLQKNMQDALITKD